MQLQGACYDFLRGAVVLPKTVNLRNWKIGLLFIILQVLTWTYIVGFGRHFRIWLGSNTPDGSLSFWRDLSLDKDIAALSNAERLQAPFCDTAFAALYDYVYTDDWPFVNSSCRLLPGFLRMIRSRTSIFVPTYLTETLSTSQHTADVNSDGRCNSECDELQNHTESSIYSAWNASGALNRYGHCICEHAVVTGSFLLGVEKVTIGLEFSAILEDEAGHQQVIRQADADKNVLTVFRDPETRREIRTVLPGDPITTDIWQLLTMGGYSLEDRLHTQPNLLGEGFSEFPVLRMTGMEMTVTFKFHNKADIHHLESDHEGPVCYVEVRINPKWTSKENVVEDAGDLFDTPSRRVRYMYGINIDIRPGGSVAYFDFQGFFTLLASFIVYLQLPLIIVSFLAKFLLGKLSVLYQTALTEGFHSLTVLHGQCSRLLAAKETYMWLLNKQMRAHPSQNECLMESFFRQELSSVMHENRDGNHSLTDEEISTLINMVMSVIDEDRSGTVPFPEFVNSFSNSEVCSLTDHAQVFNFNRKWGILEKMFQPSYISQAKVHFRKMQASGESERGSSQLSNSQSCHTEIHTVDELREEISGLKRSQDEYIKKINSTLDCMDARIDRVVIARLEKLGAVLGTAAAEFQDNLSSTAHTQPKPSGGRENKMSQVVSCFALLENSLGEFGTEFEGHTTNEVPIDGPGEEDVNSSKRDLPRGERPQFLGERIMPLKGDLLGGSEKVVSEMQWAQQGQARTFETVCTLPLIVALDERILQLENMIGHLHETDPEDHQAFDFDVSLKSELSNFNKADYNEYYNHFIRRLGCDHVEMECVRCESDKNKKTARVTAIGFANLEAVAQAASQLKGRAGSTYPPYELVGDVKQRRVSHKASYWLQMQRLLCKTSLLEQDGRPAPASVDPSSMFEWHFEHMNSKVQKIEENVNRMAARMEEDFARRTGELYRNHTQ